MGFLSPWFLAGLAAIALPLWLHLLRQFKRTPQPFSSLMFFERRVQSSVRHRRLRYLVLLALRLALLVLLALAFANPFVMRSTATQNRRKLTLLAIDRSFSMRAGGHMEKAKEEARRLVAALPSGFLAQVAALDSHLETVTVFESDRSTLNAGVEALTPNDQASSFGELARALRLMSKTANMQIEAHFISDMQRSSLPSKGFIDLQLEPGTTLELHSVAQSKTENWAVENVAVAAQIYDPKRSRLTATIAGWQTPAATRQVSLVLNGRAVASKNVAVPANGRAQVEFLGFDVPYGANRGEIRLEPHDSLPDDDVYPFAIEHADPRRVLFLYAGGRSREGFYYKAAMESSTNTGLLVDQAPLEQVANLDLAKFALVVLSDPGECETQASQRLRSYVERGGGILLAIGANTARCGAVPVTDAKVSAGNMNQAVGDVDTQSSSVSEAGRFENVQFLHTARLQPKAGAKVIAKFADGSPLLLEERIGEGRALTFAAMLDSSNSDFPLHASYLPFVVQSGLDLSGASDSSSSAVVGTPATLRRSKSETTAADVIGPTGKHELALADAAKALTFDLAQAGFYEVQTASGRRSLMAVHPDRRESDLTVIPDETLVLWRNTGSMAPTDKTATTQNLTAPWSLWRSVLLLVLIAACVESVFAARYLKEERQTA
jgi:hypothetical protein